VTTSVLDLKSRAKALLVRLIPVSFTGRFVARTALRRAPLAFAAAEEPLSRLVRGRGVFSNRSEVDP
jgi:hypothetical protein